MYARDFVKCFMTPIRSVQKTCLYLLSVASKSNANIEICLPRLTLSLSLSVGVFACRLFSSYWCYFNKRQGTAFLSYMSIKGGRLAGENDACYKQWPPQCHTRPRSDPHFQPWPPYSHNNSQILIPEHVDLRLTAASMYTIVRRTFLTATRLLVRYMLVFSMKGMV